MTEEVLNYIKTHYDIESEHLFRDADVAVFRHRSTKKWFGIMMRIPLCKLGLPTEQTGCILNLKAEPLFIDSIVDRRRIFRAYHMNKEHWISVLLDGSVPLKELQFLIQTSFQLTAPKR